VREFSPALVAIELGPVVITTVGAVITFAVGLALGWVQRLGRYVVAAVRARRQADHVTITSGWFHDDLSCAAEFLVSIRVAPSKSLAGPAWLEANQVAAFVRGAFGDLFPESPEYSNPTELIRYRTANDGQIRGIDQSALVWSSGLIEATVPITHSLDDAGQPIIALIEIARAVLPAIGAIQQGGYAQIFGSSALRPHGLDWAIGLSRELAGDKSTPWAALAFPGREPSGRATGMRPPWGRPGFGQDQLRSVSTRTAPDDILVPALADLMDRSGYYGSGPAVSDLRAAIRQLDIQAARPGSPAKCLPSEP
jgi:hypothetical protein